MSKPSVLHGNARLAGSAATVRSHYIGTAIDFLYNAGARSLQIECTDYGFEITSQTIDKTKLLPTKVVLNPGNLSAPCQPGQAAPPPKSVLRRPPGRRPHDGWYSFKALPYLPVPPTPPGPKKDYSGHLVYVDDLASPIKTEPFTLQHIREGLLVSQIVQQVEPLNPPPGAALVFMFEAGKCISAKFLTE